MFNRNRLLPLSADVRDLNFDGIFEAALDLPRIYFLLKKDVNGPPLEYEGQFELNWAFLDTGAFRNTAFKGNGRNARRLRRS